MEIQEYIECAKSFTNSPEHDYVGRERWINDGLKQDFFAWRMEVLTFLQTSFGKIPPVLKFEVKVLLTLPFIMILWMAKNKLYGEICTILC